MSLWTFIFLLVISPLLIGPAIMIGLFFLARKLYLSWRKPYKRATDSLYRTSHPALPFLQEFMYHPLFLQWLRTEANREQTSFALLLCATDEKKREYLFSTLMKTEQKSLNRLIRQKGTFRSEDIDYTMKQIRGYMDQEYQHPTKKLDLSFYTLYFYSEYGDVLKYIQSHKRLVNSQLQVAIEYIVISVLRSIPYYKEQRMYEQQHKFEAFLTKDLPEMLTLISKLQQPERSEKEEELTAFLVDFEQDIAAAKKDIALAVEHALNVKMRATKVKFEAN
ncbi:DUF3974 domain-containing protein [Microbacteriaceae bacterium 4G12]